jgi:hypothetical protein
MCQSMRRQWIRVGMTSENICLRSDHSKALPISRKGYQTDRRGGVVGIGKALEDSDQNRLFCISLAVLVHDLVKMRDCGKGYVCAPFLLDLAR